MRPALNADRLSALTIYYGHVDPIKHPTHQHISMDAEAASPIRSIRDAAALGVLTQKANDLILEHNSQITMNHQQGETIPLIEWKKLGKMFDLG